MNGLIRRQRIFAADRGRPDRRQETEPGEIAANAAERARLAERFGLLALDRLTASRCSSSAAAAARYQMHGRFEADVVQACVVTLEPVRRIWSRISRRVSRPAARPMPARSWSALDDAEDPPEEIVEGRIDLGEAVAQQLAVALDPYPRAPAAGRSGGPGQRRQRMTDADGESVRGARVPGKGSPRKPSA